MYNSNHVLQGKGGIGKSLVSSLIMQVEAALNNNPLGIDSDPVNKTLSRHTAMNVRPLDIIENNKINSRAFDAMVEWIYQHQGATVVDNGATSFIPATAYIAETGALEVLASMQRRVLLHSILIAGQEQDDTVDGLNALIASTTAPIVVWLNERNGPLVDRHGTPFHESDIYQNHRDRIAGIVTIHQRDAQCFGEDIRQMTTQNLTFAEVLASDWPFMPKHRLRQVWDDLFNQLAPILRGQEGNA
ncbi:conjugal transfer protein TraL [Chromobacterium haemolyticum]|uniref:conjugal transfer protein TraL n=1 Tax=Chromobacterium haemolyticum TaxID=394935 RepID=UPI0017476BEE|nr:conjugal transfer protein TraL [Chromobacterium haemolyticum]QOD84154.1 conjugal transfer protein TraL [Chromobacterium haemolyticum]